jgi:hypothetical protein
MNPTLEVQITARLDKLESALKMAESKVSQSAATMGKAGEKAGANVMQGFASNLPMMMVATAMAHTIGKGISQAVKDVNAGKSGEEIGLGMAQGIVDGAKSLPVVGIVFEIFDEIVNGAERAAELISKKVGVAVAKQIDSTKAMMDSLKSFTQGTEDIIDTTSAGSDPTKMLDVKNKKTEASEIKQVNDIKEQEEQRHRDRIAAINAKFDAQQKSTDFEVYREYSSKKRNAEIEKAREQHQKQIGKIDDEASKRDDARQTEYLAALKEINAKAAADEKTANDKAVAEKKKADDALVEIAKKQAKEKIEAAIQAQQDIIDGEKAAQEQIDKIGRVDQLAAQAAQGMIGSGQTALGQFNFAQSGAGNQAITLAQKQVTSLEKIEAATAMQVQLQKEMRGFN